MSSSHSWLFFRAGGFDQVRLDTAADLLNLKYLDQKLWVSLSCPTTGIEFDARTLALVDTDADGHIRAPELLAAIDWAAARLSTPDVLGQNKNGVPVAAIKDESLAELARSLCAEGVTLLTPETALAAEAKALEQALTGWDAQGAATREQNATAAAAVEPLRAKIDDFFARCRLAAFDARAGEALNGAGDIFTAMAPDSLATHDARIAALPLAQVGAGRTAPLTGEGINPAWAASMAVFLTDAVTPLLGVRTELTDADWQQIKARLADYDAWLAAKPTAETTTSDSLRDLGRLACYVRDLLALANNFVAFRDFYMRDGKAMFQMGTLYLDGRSAELCVAVSDAAKHGALASLSRMCLVYCECTRPGEKQTIAAAFTAGDSDQLIVGRNGIFYDRQGRDWDATISKIIDHPISLRQAFWSPYKRLGRLVSEQLQKMAASKAAGVDGKLAGAAGDVGKVATPAAAAVPAPKAPPTPFDVGKFAGIFAAIGLAIGAIGTAAASMVTGMLGLHWWQMPLVLLGLMLLISGPSMIMAWFKLRSRNLGPLLDANGWAVNARARINIPFGTSLTQMAVLPAGAERALIDPYAEKQSLWKLYVGVIAVIFAALVWVLR
ncbi:MAG: hypothetical protein IPG34_02165 [Rhodocyclaceae bacterium]|nr:hypothetical protein [Rhodocyclaceae bacterium]